MKRHGCDLCGSQTWAPIPVSEPRGIGICQVCGFCYVRDRRAAHEIAADWSNVYGAGYDPDNWPAVKARLYYVQEWLEEQYPGDGPRSLLDIGAGTGTFLGILELPFLTEVHGLEPSTAGSDNPRITRGSVEDDIDLGQFDFVTINWTLENCGDCIKMLDYARRRCKPDGRVIVATGSRILVPFKKPLHTYLGDNSPDLHCFRWSAQTLDAAFAKAGLLSERINPFRECDWLVMAAQPVDGARVWKRDFPFDPPQVVAEFFRAWERMWP